MARSTSASKKAKDISRSDHFWKLRCRLLEVEMSKKCTPLWRKAHFQVKSAKTLRGSEHFWTFRCRFAWQAQGILHPAKVSKSEKRREGFCGIFKNDGGRGTYAEDLQRWISRGRRSTRDMFIRDVRRSGR